MVQILTNHIGYDLDSTKTAVFQGRKDITPSTFFVKSFEGDMTIFEGVPTLVGEVDNWQTGYYYTLSFDDVKTEGKFYILLNTDKGDYKSFPFTIEYNLLAYKTLSSATYYFKAQRSTGEFEHAERELPFRGNREGRFDVRGGWFDATGDYGIHLSHLSHTTYFNPQQAAFSAYSFFKMNDILEESDFPYFTMLKRRMLDEAIYGAEFIMRMRAPSGTFFRSKGRAEAFRPVNTTRAISFEYRKPKTRRGGGVTEGYDDITDVNYETSLRSGGGYAIATLAYAARTTYPSDFTKEEYLDAAISALNFLAVNNNTFTNDGEWNLIDEYCYLDALVEVYKTTREFDYLRRAKEIVDRIMAKYVAVSGDMGYLSVNGTDRPFFHAADAGMPVVNLLNYYEVEKDTAFKEQVLDICNRLMRHELYVTNKQKNPFGYARQLIKDSKGKIEDRFFYPHDVETSPWWQGENARIASLSTAARKLSFHTNDAELALALNKYADDQINWVLGLNPYDSCMMEGAGRNTNEYFFNGRRDFIHCPGGIVNGITGGLNDEEHGIEFVTTPNAAVQDNWRWAEQWIPHATWYMYALVSKRL